MSAIAIIPAKGTSHRVPGKNRKMFHRYPVIRYSIQAAQDSGLFGRIVVSTDDDWIGRYSEGCGATWYRRASALTEESVGTQEVAADVISAYRDGGDPYGFACCIYPCAPLITATDLREAYRQVQEHPYNYVYADGQFYFAVAERFISEPDNFTHSLRMESLRYIDINTPEDWEKAEAMYAALHPEVA